MAVRILLATEGETDEIAACKLIALVAPHSVIDPKRFPARGFKMVERLIPDTVRAGHFGYYDALVVHFDLDNTLPANAQNVQASPRWQSLHAKVQETLAQLPTAHRATALSIVFMNPRQSLEAWFAWGKENQDGIGWELKNRHDLKTMLFGQPPLDVLEKAEQYACALIEQMRSGTKWPLSLQEFYTTLQAILPDSSVS